MAQDDLISKLVDDTFGTEFERPRIVGNRDDDFDLMTQLSKLPIHFFKGHYVSNDLVEFAVSGKVIHVSLKHLESSNLKNFSSVIQTLVNQRMDSSTIIKSQKSLWFLAWNKQDDVTHEKLFQIFKGKAHRQAA